MLTWTKAMLTNSWRDMKTNLAEMKIRLPRNHGRESSNVMQTVLVDAVDGELMKDMLNNWQWSTPSWMAEPKSASISTV